MMAKCFRKPVAAVRDPNLPTPIIVCDDGSTWKLLKKKWREETPIPGSARALEVEEEKALSLLQEAAESGGKS